jgi:Leucine-rich repeat (LRR) protein
MSSKVLDLTFLDLEKSKNLEVCCREKIQEQFKTSEISSLIKAIRLSYNNLESLYEVTEIISKILVDCSNILWIDLSFNKFDSIPSNFIATFPRLTIIYFQSNRISKFSQISKLSQLSNLKSLVLYSNPIEELKVISK